MKKSLLLLALMVFSLAGFAQKGQRMDKDQNLTWLGLDFTHLKFIGTAAQWKDAGDISNAELRNKYFPGWNDLVANERDRYDIAKASGFADVTYKPEVANSANSTGSKTNYFTDDAGDFQMMTEMDVRKVVGQYNYKGATGTGLIFIVEGMDKGRDAASMWVTFVDIGNKQVLATRRYVGKSGGIGFRNYWAKAILNVLKDMKGDF